MHMSENLDQILPEFYQFQQDVKNPKKAAEGYGYKYMTLDDLIDHAREAMAGRGLSFSQEVRSGDNGDIELMTRIYHVSGQWLSFGPLVLPKDNGKKMNRIQQAGSAITYARRYSLAAALGIASEIDSDGQEDLPGAPEAQQDRQQEGGGFAKEPEVKNPQPPAPEPPIKTLRKYYQQNLNGARSLIDGIIEREGSLNQMPVARHLSIISDIETKK